MTHTVNGDTSAGDTYYEWWYVSCWHILWMVIRQLVTHTYEWWYFSWWHTVWMAILQMLRHTMNGDTADLCWHICLMVILQLVTHTMNGDTSGAGTYTTQNLLGITVYGGIIFLGMGIMQKLNMSCIRGQVYFMNFIVVYQIWTIDNTHSVIKVTDTPKWRFHNVTPGHENVRNSSNTRINDCQ